MVTKAGSYLRPIDSCITQPEAHGPFGTCNESKEEEDLSIDRVAMPSDESLHLLKPFCLEERVDQCGENTHLQGACIRV